jgi:sodium transport system permease protein
LAVPLQIPSPEIIYTTANEQSQLAFARLTLVLQRWMEEIVQSNLAASGVPPTAAKPFTVETADVAEQTSLHGAAIWSKLLPMLLLIWAMTGAFYPAVDLCAGEKERGTLETLLSSPAERSEIVLGKLLTIMFFSMLTASLNLASMALMGWFVLAKLPGLGAPPVFAVPWLVAALVPVSALFSALCLALAAFARSTKEGQYYLMPLLLITLPLAMLPMASGVELTLGNSLIPVAGLMLLLRSALEGGYWQVLQFTPPVVVVTLGCCYLAIRWAVEQFNSESVLFRESERLDMGLWLRHLLTDRKPTPTVAAAVFCGVLILVIRFVMSVALPEPLDFRQFAVTTLATQLAVVVVPALLMTLLFTSSPRKTLLLHRPSWLTLPAAVALAVVLHPAMNALQWAVMKLYPLGEEMHWVLRGMDDMLRSAPFWQILLIMAVTPAICEELAFRGFILSGFRHLGHKWRAIVFSAVFFGLTHAILQQSLIASLVGVIIGVIAVQSGSILPGMLFHMVHNSLALASTQISDATLERLPWLQHVLAPVETVPQAPPWELDAFAWGSTAFSLLPVAVSVVATLALLAWFNSLPYTRSREEQEQDAIRRALRAEA